MKFKKITAMLLSAALLASFTVTGCGNKVNTDAVAAKLDGKEIGMGVANFMAQYQAAQTDLYFLSYYGEDMWTSDSGDGTTMTDSVKNIWRFPGSGRHCSSCFLWQAGCFCIVWAGGGHFPLFF